MNSGASVLALVVTNCAEFYHLVLQIVDPLVKLRGGFLVLYSDTVDDLLGKSVEGCRPNHQQLPGYPHVH